MITGFNTDIEFAGVTYHVQTEDKGISKPIILSLVYDRGTILASKRIPYDDLLQEDLDETVLAERLQKQHRLICAAVQSGRIEDLVKMTRRDASTARKKKIDQKHAAMPIPLPEPETLLWTANVAFDTAVLNRDSPIPRPEFLPLMESHSAPPALPSVQNISVTDDDIILADEAVAIIDDDEIHDRPANNKLSVEIVGECNFKGGERRTVSFMVCRGSARRVIRGAEIMVKILGSNFRPLIFHVTTDDNGVASVNLQLPNFYSGRAVFLVRALSEGEEVELRRSIEHG